MTLALLGHGDPLSHDAVQVRVLLEQVDVEVELEGGGGTRRLQGVVCVDRGKEGVERGVKAMMVLQVRLRDQGRDRVHGGEDRQLLPVGVPHQNLVEEAEALQLRLKTRRAPRRAERGGVDACHVLAERVVERQYCVDRACHDGRSPSVASRSYV
jgi:hypothetical protein